MAAKKQNKFSIELEPDILARCDEEVERLKPLVKSRSRFINLLLAQRYGLAADAFRAFQEISSEPELQAGVAVAQHQ